VSTARNLVLTAAGLLGACSTVPEAQRDVAVERDLPLPLPEAAVVVAEAMRTVLPFADPVPYSGGAPATVLDGDRYVVSYEQCYGNWLPRADQRLLCAGSRVTAKAVTLPGYGLNAQRVILLEITRGDSGTEATASTVRGTMPRHLTLPFEHAVLRALAAHTAAATPIRHLEQARQFALAGQAEHALRLRDHALLAAADPAFRAHVLRQVATPSSGLSARHQARQRLVAGDLNAARALLHTARRTAPVPSYDYQLLWQLHRSEDADCAALASALLAREHAGMTEAAVSLELRRCGLSGLVDRMAEPPLEFETRATTRTLSAMAAPAK